MSALFSAAGTVPRMHPMTSIWGSSPAGAQYNGLLAFPEGVAPGGPAGSVGLMANRPPGYDESDAPGSANIRRDVEEIDGDITQGQHVFLSPADRGHNTDRSRMLSLSTLNRVLAVVPGYHSLRADQVLARFTYFGIDAGETQSLGEGVSGPSMQRHTINTSRRVTCENVWGPVGNGDHVGFLLVRVPLLVGTGAAPQNAVAADRWRRANAHKRNELGGLGLSGKGRVVHTTGERGKHWDEASAAAALSLAGRAARANTAARRSAVKRMLRAEDHRAASSSSSSSSSDASANSCWQFVPLNIKRKGNDPAEVFEECSLFNGVFGNVLEVAAYVPVGIVANTAGQGSHPNPIAFGGGSRGTARMRWNTILRYVFSRTPESAVEAASGIHMFDMLLTPV